MNISIFIYGQDGKIGRGNFDFFDSNQVEKFVREGGNITLRTQNGDISFAVSPKNETQNALKQLNEDSQ